MEQNKKMTLIKCNRDFLPNFFVPYARHNILLGRKCRGIIIYDPSIKQYICDLCGTVYQEVIYCDEVE